MDKKALMFLLGYLDDSQWTDAVKSCNGVDYKKDSIKYYMLQVEGFYGTTFVKAHKALGMPV